MIKGLATPMQIDIANKVVAIFISYTDPSFLIAYHVPFSILDMTQKSHSFVMHSY